MGRAHFQTAQCLAADHADRSRQTGTALEPATGRRAPGRVSTGASQSRDSGGGTHTGGLSAGGRQEGKTISVAHAAPGGADPRHVRIEPGSLKSCLSSPAGSVWTKPFRTCRRSAGRSSLLRGLRRGEPPPDAPFGLFRGWPAHPNSIFVDGNPSPFPQMDVWPRCRVGRAEGSRAARKIDQWHHNPSGSNPRRSG